MTRGVGERAVTTAGELIVTSRLLVLQSKRLLLNSAWARLKRRQLSHEQHQIEVERLHSEVGHAQGRYNDAVLQWAAPNSPQYRLIAYSSLIAKGERLLESLRGALEDLPAHDRTETLEEISKLEKMVAGWRDVTRVSMAMAVA